LTATHTMEPSAYTCR